MDNEGGMDPMGDPNDQLGLAGQIDTGAEGGDGGAGDDNVDQYFDDGGETFLPADHVGKSLLYGHFAPHDLIQI